MERRGFIKNLMAATALSSLPSTALFSNTIQERQTTGNKDLIWANLIHLSTNMWEDNPHIKWPGVSCEVYKDDFECKTRLDAIAWGMRAYRPFLVFDEPLWNKILHDMVKAGFNMVIIDLGDAVQYQSHPEIAITNAWSIDKLKTELVKIRQLGLEPIPKLNFATSHDTWLGEYHRMVSTREYYAVCSDLISEVIELFDTPRFFHIGMDEEDYKNQVQYRYATVRQGDLWWKDFYFFVDQVEKKGVRPWIWSDYGWHYPDVFFKKMPKSVLQSNWYYDVQFGDLTGLEESHKTRYNMYYELEKHGYDQVPTGSNFNNNLNMEGTVRHFKNVIDPSRLLGFMSAPWLPTMPQCAASHKEAIEQLGRAKNEFMSK